MHDARSTAPVRRCAWAAWLGLMAVAANAGPGRADDAAATPFVPGDISIGEPIVLPADQPAVAPDTVATPIPAAAVIPGNGWLGISLDVSATPGRWVVAEVAPGSPAAEAGIRVGDDVRAINGMLLRSHDDVAQSLTAIAAGQTVSVAIARDESVNDVRMTAVPRPTRPAARGGVEPPGEVSVQTADRDSAALPTSPPLSPPATNLQPPAAWTQSVVSASADAPLPPGGTAAPPQPFAPAAAFAAAPATGFAPTAVPQTPPFQTPITAAPSASAAAAFPQPPAGTTGRGRTALGVRTLPVNADTQARFRLPALRGAYVIGVVQDLPAARAGLPPGSVIVALDARPVTSPDDLTRLVTAGPVGRPVSLEYVLPGGESKQAEVVLQPLELPLEQALVGGPTATGAPTLLPSPAPTASPPAESLPYRANRPADAAAVEATRVELRHLRARIDALERALGPALPRR